MALKMWELVPDSFKNEKSLERFKNRVNTWTTDKFPCRISNIYRLRERISAI